MKRLYFLNSNTFRKFAERIALCCSESNLFKNKAKQKMIVVKKTAYYISIWGVLVLLNSLTACQSNPFKVDVSDIDVELTIVRFDSLLFETPPAKLAAEMPQWRKEHADFFDNYVASMQIDDSNYQSLLLGFATHRDWHDVYTRVKKLYGDIQPLEQELTEAFKHYRYYFPEKSVPDIYTCISGFNYKILPDYNDGNTVGLALDMYLGDDCEFYAMGQIEKYKRYNMRREKIAPDLLMAMAMTDFPQDSEEQTDLISQMIYHGKLLFFTKSMLPECPDSVLLGYSGRQFDWAMAYEKNIWSFMVEQNHLFSSDQAMIRKYIGESPFTAYFNNNSAPRAGMFIGWRIVLAYMDQHPDMPLDELMSNTDYRLILNQAKYNPKNR